MRLGISAPESDEDIYNPALFSLIDKRIQYLGVHADKQQKRISELEKSITNLLGNLEEISSYVGEDGMPSISPEEFDSYKKAKKLLNN